MSDSEPAKGKRAAGAAGLGETKGDAGFLMAVRIGSVILSLATGVLLARMMGPERLGEFGLFQALAGWFMLLGMTGGNDVIVRFGPETMKNAGQGGIRNLFASLLGMRLATGSILSAGYFFLFLMWLPEMPRPLVIAMATAMFLTTLSNLFFATLLGVGETRKWGILPLLISILRFAFVPVGFHLGGIHGAVAATLLVRFVVLVFGVVWARGYLAWPSWRVRSLVPYVPFASSLFLAAVLGSGVGASGVYLVRFAAHDLVEVGYFSIALAVFTDSAFILPRLAMTYIPALVSLREDGREEEMSSFLSGVFGCFSVMTVVVVFLLLLPLRFGLPLLMGERFEPAMVNLIPFCGAFLLLVLFTFCRSLAVTGRSVRPIVVAQAIRLVVFWAVGWGLAASWGSYGASVAFLVASVFATGWVVLALWQEVRSLFFKWLKIVGLGACFAPAILIPQGIVEASLVFLCLVPVFLAGIVYFRIVGLEDLVHVHERFAFLSKRPLPR